MIRSITRRLLVGITITLMTVALGRIDVKGYATVGYKWGTSQVLFYVNPQSIYLSPLQVITALNTAALGWTAQTLASVQLINAGTTNGSSLTMNNKNEVFFRNDVSWAGAETYWWADWTGHLVDADTVFHEGSYQFFTVLGCYGTGAYLEDMAIHEFGHTLGLAHSSEPGTTMYPYMPSYCDMSQLTLELDDIAGIEALYPATGRVSSPPASPTDLNVAPGSYDPTSSLVMWWADNAGDEDGYRVERSLDGASFQYLTQVTANTNWFTDSGLESGRTYYYRVYSFNKGGSSGYSNIAWGQTQSYVSAPPPAETAPTLQARAVKKRGWASTRLSWSGASTSTIDIYRNGTYLLSTPNDGSETDTLGQRISGSFTYQICQTGTWSCSNAASVTF